MKQNAASKVKALLEETIIEKGFSLWDITFGKEGGEMLLTVTVDKEGGISMEMLSELNEAVNDILDNADPIEGAYSLMLESAGAERPLRTDDHIKFAMDKKAKVELKLYKAVEGVKEFDGIIVSYDGENMVFEAEMKEEAKLQKKGTKKTVNKAVKTEQTENTETKTFVFERKAISKMCAYL